jgi:SulP family sulfate permease
MIEGGIRFQWGPSAMGPASFQGVDLMVAFFLLAIPQFPLTFGNAMVGTSSAARAYFPEAGKRVTVRKLGFSYGIANIASALLGGMPMCQGAGGLTAHVRFGARTARSTILFGALMITLGMTTGRSAPAILSLIPSPVLGSLLAIVGWEHSRLARDVGGKSSQMLVVFIMGITSLLTANLLYGLAAGIAVGLLLHFVPGNKKWHDIFGPFESL